MDIATLKHIIQDMPDEYEVTVFTGKEFIALSNDYEADYNADVLTLTANQEED